MLQAVLAVAWPVSVCVCVGVAAAAHGDAFCGCGRDAASRNGPIGNLVLFEVDEADEALQVSAWHCREEQDRRARRVLCGQSKRLDGKEGGGSNILGSH